MATFYLDFENGNDANDGTTFANRWKTITNGATAARIAPGDEIRIMGSPAPTSLGINATWTSQALQSTKAITGATNASPISITCVGHGYSTGDTVVVESVAGNTSANGTWEITVTGTDTFTLDGSTGNGTYTSGGTARLRNNTVVRLASALTANIASTGPRTTAWTASANVTTSLSTTTKEHYQSDSIAIAAGFTTGLAAYFPTGTLDLSGYQQVSFWIRQVSGTIGAAGSVDLRLCSDTAGVTSVNTISIPNLAVTGRWMPVTVDLGTNLGSSIQSIAFYVNTDNGAQTFLLSNIIACKASSAADSLSLSSLIGKNISGETWWGVQSINGTRVMLDADTNAAPAATNSRGYYGTSETVTTWKRETIKVGPIAGVVTAANTVQDSGTLGNPITFSGGWNRVDMSTQTLETWLDGVNGNGYGVAVQTRSFLVLTRLAALRFLQAFNNNSVKFSDYDLISASNCSNVGASFGGVVGSTITIRGAAGNISSGISTTAIADSSFVISGPQCSNAAAGMFIGGALNTRIAGTTGNICANNGSSGVTCSGPSVYLQSIRTADNVSSGIQSIANGAAFMNDCKIDDTIEFVAEASSYSSVYSQSHDETPGNHKILATGGLISSATDQRKTASGISWKLQPTSTDRSSAWPLTLSLAKVACAANSLVTVKAWMRRDNSGLTMRLVCKGGQIAGVTNDVTASVTTTDTWEEETITFTPTEAGVVEITAEAWGGTTYSGWVDDLTISQA